MESLPDMLPVTGRAQERMPTDVEAAIPDVLVAPLPDAGTRANHTLVRHERFDYLLSLMARCQERSKLSDEPKCMALEGVTGAGKSTLVRRYARDYPPYATAGGMCIPVFRVETPSPVSPRGMASAMLEALQDPYYDRGTGSILQTRLAKLLKACAVELVILDDFHHLIDADTDRVLQTVSDWLKVLLKETHIPFVVIGMPNSLKRIFNANAQLARLFPIREHLGTLQGLTELHAFLNAFEAETQAQIAPEHDRTDLLQRLAYATDGVVGFYSNLLRESIGEAAAARAPVVQMKHLHQGFAFSLAAVREGISNPFDVHRFPVPFVAPMKQKSGHKRKQAGAA